MKNTTGLLLALLSTPLLAHQGHVHKFAAQACVDKTLSQVCEYSPDQKHLYQGSCQSMTGTLMCVRNKPIITSDTVMPPDNAQSDQHHATLGPSDTSKQPLTTTN
ncbi:hypothetical protein [Rheinheimera baltica]|uniref:Uncharacterized protein n=1 Tax=Rheinheimera baltica TaxID=67576 RepID=A0ABT9I499_9GAMM|nr:hypothetical protein [Rheinheimera baltica]MDP5138208.1 hypothetical protein [Rheinheimera baltica]MDP5141138.1 hypothetical protein [Rheinheimera baltica]MDP5148367.1 hypothetical protein [Rheinheimera baltica]MDP5191335.1 hypothetical protein [Rheinheimera baltica]